MRITYKSSELRFKEKREKYCKWHESYAILPKVVKNLNGSKTFIWLERFGRRGRYCVDRKNSNHYYIGSWEYCVYEDLSAIVLKNGNNVIWEATYV